MVHATNRRPGPLPMPPLTPLWTLLAFALMGVAAGIAQMRAERQCPCCRQTVARSYERCPHCRCRME